jgi:lipopolysaccharide/colanic/teichoic acid biosynthesis glycosyltransferase
LNRRHSRAWELPEVIEVENRAARIAIGGRGAPGKRAPHLQRGVKSGKSTLMRGKAQEGMGNDPGGNKSLRRVAKRFIDIVVSSVGLLILLPVFALIVIAIKLTSKGPVFYRWRVVGEGGCPITSYKFRSMHKDADKRKADLLAHNEMAGPVFKMTHDPRITSLGRILRKYSLDELPQLWSVLKGDLSLVGPRPPLQSEYQQFSDWQRQKVSVKPGLTCLWQVSGRNQISDFDDWVQLDLKYIREWSLALDFKILLKTIPAVVLGRGK